MHIAVETGTFSVQNHYHTSLLFTFSIAPYLDEGVGVEKELSRQKVPYPSC